MVAVPAVPPVTTPPALIAATRLLLVLHAPPVVASANVTVNPWHTLSIPVIPAGSGLTVTGLVI